MDKKTIIKIADLAKIEIKDDKINGSLGDEESKTQNPEVKGEAALNKIKAAPLKEHQP